MHLQKANKNAHKPICHAVQLMRLACSLLFASGKDKGCDQNRKTVPRFGSCYHFYRLHLGYVYFYCNKAQEEYQ